MSGTEPLLDGLDPHITVRQIVRVFQSDRESWEILFDGDPIGAIRQTRIRRSSS